MDLKSHLSHLLTILSCSYTEFKSTPCLSVALITRETLSIMNDSYMVIKIRIGGCFEFARKPNSIMLYLFVAFQLIKETFSVFTNITKHQSFPHASKCCKPK